MSATQFGFEVGADANEGAEVARVVLDALRSDPRAVRVHLALTIQENRVGPRPKRVSVQSAARVGSEWTSADVIELMNEAYSLDYVYGGRIVGGVVTIIPPEANNGAGTSALMNAPMRRAHVGTCLAVAESAPWETNEGTCVFDFIESRYSGVRALKSKGRQDRQDRGAREGREARGDRGDRNDRRSALCDIFGAVCPEPERLGVTTAAVARFCRLANVRMIAAGPDGVVFHREKGSERHPVLAYAVANGHMFPVLDAAEVSYMARFGLLRHRKAERGAGLRDRDVPVVDESSACDLVAVAHVPRIVVTTADLTSVWTRLMQVSKRTFPAAATHGTFRVVRFRANGVVVYANDEYPDMRRVARRLGVRCAPADGIGTLSRRFFESRVPVLRRLGLAGIPPRLRVGTPRTAFLGAAGACGASGAESWPDNGPSEAIGASGADGTEWPNGASLRCFDVRGCYAEALRSNGGLEWAVPGPFDELEPYDGQPLGAGRFFIVEPFGPALPLVRGDGWFYERYVRWRVQRGATVYAQQRARRTLAHDTFAAAIDECRARLGPESKRVINSFIGTTFPHTRERGRCVASTELEEAIALSPVVREVDGTALAYKSLAARGCTGDLQFIYEQVVEGGWVSVDELREALDQCDCSFVAVKTDSVIVEKKEKFFTEPVAPLAPTEPTEPSTPIKQITQMAPMIVDPRWREDAVGPPVTVTLPSPERLDLPSLSYEWEDCGNGADGTNGPNGANPEGTVGAGLLIVGSAGTGKTWLARRVVESSSARVVRVAPTNKAAAHIGGVTMHALFGIHDPETFCDAPDLRAVQRVARRCDVMLVDEVFMCTCWMYGTMLALHDLGVRFVLCGDPYQLPPVGEDMDPLVVLASSCVHALCGGRRAILTEPRRSAADPSLFLSCSALISSPPSRESNRAFVEQFQRTDETAPGPDRALAFLNATAARFNREQATKARRSWRWLVHEPEKEPEIHTTRWTLRRASAEARIFPLRAPVVAASSFFVARGTRCVIRSFSNGPAGPTVSKNSKGPKGPTVSKNSKGPGGPPVAQGSGPEDQAFVLLEIDGPMIHNGTSGPTGPGSSPQTVRVPMADFSAAFDLAYCVTIHRAQCDTIDEPYAVLDTNRIVALNPTYARALIYVAASRATKKSFVSFL